VQPLLYRFATALLLAMIVGFAAAETEPTTKNWEPAGTIARAKGVPVVMVVTGNGCGHCERMKREFLSDPQLQTYLGERAQIRIYYQDTDGKITDFDGERVRARIFISRYDIFAAPTLLFLDPDGRPLADPLVGYNDAVSYRDLMTERLDQAQLALKTDRGQAAPALAVARP
jgi:thioredoxin-related protein